jgi:transcriptional regulator with XRE-family HTH domain
MTLVMPRRSRLKLPPLNLGDEPVGKRIARLRKERGYSQDELARKIGIIQVLVSNYELGKLRLHGEMVVRFAKALGVSADEILGMKPVQPASAPKGRLLKRLRAVELLSKTDQRAVLKHIDSLLKASGAHGNRNGHARQSW